MEKTIERDFASYLDAVRPVAEDPDEVDMPGDELSQPPTIPFDYLAVAEELHSGRITVAPDRRRRTPQEPVAAYRAELEAYLDAAMPFVDAAPTIDPTSVEPLPSIEPDEIAVELGLAAAGADDYTRIRRRFAFDNHPDRVAPHLRERAMRRMQIANGLIDDARAARARAKP